MHGIAQAAVGVKPGRDASEAEALVNRVHGLANSMEGLRNRIYALHEQAFGPEPRALGTAPTPSIQVSGFLPQIRQSLDDFEGPLKEAHEIMETIETRLRV